LSCVCSTFDLTQAYILIDEAAANKLSAEARAIFRPNVPAANPRLLLSVSCFSHIVPPLIAE
jgi:hypothetical protein